MIEKLAACCAALETDAYLVGGSVRDWLLSAKPGQDIDIAVSGDPEAIAREIAGRFGGTVVPLGPAHGIVRVAVSADDEAEEGPRNIDVDGFPGTLQ